MKYCTKCGAEMIDEAVICVSCGAPVNNGVSKAVASNYAKRVKEAKTLSIISIGVTIAYFLTAVWFLIISYLILSGFAFLIQLFAFFVDIVFIAALIIFNVLAITKAMRIVKDVEALPDSKAKTALEKDAKLARTLSIIGVGIAVATLII